jgi:hypothetical protein
VGVYDGVSGAQLASFLAYDSSFAGGVRVAAGDVNGDGVVDVVTGAGPGGSPHVKVFDGVTGAEFRSFFAFDPGFTGGVFVAAGDMTGDGRRAGHLHPCVRQHVCDRGHDRELHRERRRR